MYLQNCEIVDNSNGTSTITGPFITKKSYSLIVPTDGLAAYRKDKKYVQEAFIDSSSIALQTVGSATKCTNLIF